MHLHFQSIAFEELRSHFSELAAPKGKIVVAILGGEGVVDRMAIKQLGQGLVGIKCSVLTTASDPEEI